MRAPSPGHRLVARPTKHPTDGTVVEIAAQEVTGDRKHLSLKKYVVVIRREIWDGVGIQILLE